MKVLSRTLLLRADGGPGLGAGHVMRCLALAQEWQRRGGRAVLAAALLDEGLRNRAREEGVDVETLAATPASQQDAEATRDAAARHRPEWIVLDGYAFGLHYQRRLGDPARLAHIDDFGRAQGHLGRLVVDANLGAGPQHYPGRGAETRLLLGPPFALLRREFHAYRDWRRTTPPVARRLLVSFGGVPLLGPVERVLRALPLARVPFETRVVLGAAQAAAAPRGLEEPRGTIEFLPSVSDMAPLMAWAEISLTAGGSSSWELCFMGVPMLMTPVAENQVEIVAALKRAGLARSLGWFQDLDPAPIARALDDLAGDAAIRSRMSHAGRELVDGLGAQRVVDALEAAR